MTAQITDHKELLHRIATRIGKAQGRLDYLEVGVQEGHSLQAVLRCPQVQLAVGIDTWGKEAGGTGRGSPHHVTQLLGDLLMDKAVLITGDSHTLLRGLRHKFDLIFIDGDHSRWGAMMDLEDALHLLKYTGVMLFDDVDHPAHPYLRKVAEYFAGENRLQLKFHHADYGIAEFRFA